MAMDVQNFIIFEIVLAHAFIYFSVPRWGRLIMMMVIEIPD